MKSILVQIDKIEEEIKELNSLDSDIRAQEYRLVAKINKILHFLYWKSKYKEQRPFWGGFRKVIFDNFTIKKYVERSRDSYILMSESNIYFDNDVNLIAKNFDEIADLLLEEYYKVYNYASEKLNKKKILLDQINEKTTMEL